MRYATTNIRVSSDKHGDKTKRSACTVRGGVFLRVSFWAAERSQTPSTSVATIATAAHRITPPGFGSALLPRSLGGDGSHISNWINDNDLTATSLE